MILSAICYQKTTILAATGYNFKYKYSSEIFENFKGFVNCCGPPIFRSCPLLEHSFLTQVWNLGPRIVNRWCGVGLVVSPLSQLFSLKI